MVKTENVATSDFLTRAKTGTMILALWVLVWLMSSVLLGVSARTTLLLSLYASLCEAITITLTTKLSLRDSDYG